MMNDHNTSTVSSSNNHREFIMEEVTTSPGPLLQGQQGGGGNYPGGKDDDNCILWVGNLDSRVTENMLYELFYQVGPILNIRLPKSPDGQGHKGYSFITFSHESTVPYAINFMEGTTLFGKKLKLQPRPGSIHRKVMDQNNKLTSAEGGYAVAGPPQALMMQQPQTAFQPTPQPWIAHPQTAQVAPNAVIVYPNTMFPVAAAPNMNMVAIPLQPGQMHPQFVQIPVQPGTPMVMNQMNMNPPRMQNGYGVGYPTQTQQPQLRGTPSPQQQQAHPNPASQYATNGLQMVNGHGGGGGQHQYEPRRNNSSYQNRQENRGGERDRGGMRPPPPRNNNNNGGGYVNGSAMMNNNGMARVPYHQQRLPSPQSQQFLMNTFQGQGLVQSPTDYPRRANPNFPQNGQPFRRRSPSTLANGYPPGGGGGYHRY